MYDVILVFVVGFFGVIIALVSFIGIISRRINEPNNKLQKKVEDLEKEIDELKRKL